MRRTTALGVWQKKPQQAPIYLVRRGAEMDALTRPGRQFDGEIVAEAPVQIPQ